MKKHISTFNNFSNESLTNIGNLKNTVQVFNWIDIDANNKLRELILNFYRSDLNGSDTYIRYYPNDNDYDYMNQELQTLLNEYLINDGYYIDKNDEYFYILLRIDW
jgi:hypothetical protein